MHIVRSPPRLLTRGASCGTLLAECSSFTPAFIRRCHRWLCLLTRVAKAKGNPALYNVEKSAAQSLSAHQLPTARTAAHRCLRFLFCPPRCVRRYLTPPNDSDNFPNGPNAETSNANSGGRRSGWPREKSAGNYGANCEGKLSRSNSSSSVVRMQPRPVASVSTTRPRPRDRPLLLGMVASLGNSSALPLAAAVVPNLRHRSSATTTAE